MSDHLRCEAVVKRQPRVVLADNPQGRDFAFPQLCGAPVESDGLCARHLRLRDRFARVYA